MSGIDACLADAMAMPGVLGASLVDWSSGLVLGATGEGPGGDHDAAAAETTELARAAVESGSITTGITGKLPVEDIIVTTPSGYHLIRFVDTAFDSTVFLYLRLDRDKANLAVALFRLRTVVERLVVG
jgi:hypothetical protein